MSTLLPPGRILDVERPSSMPLKVRFAPLTQVYGPQTPLSADKHNVDDDALDYQLERLRSPIDATGSVHAWMPRLRPPPPPAAEPRRVSTAEFYALLNKVELEAWLGIAAPLMLASPILLATLMWDVGVQYRASRPSCVAAAISGMVAGVGAGAASSAALLYASHRMRAAFELQALPRRSVSIIAAPTVATLSAVGVGLGLNHGDLRLALRAGATLAGGAAGWLVGYALSVVFRASWTAQNVQTPYRVTGLQRAALSA